MNYLADPVAIPDTEQRYMVLCVLQSYRNCNPDCLYIDKVFTKFVSNISVIVSK